MKVWFSWAEY